MWSELEAQTGTSVMFLSNSHHRIVSPSGLSGVERSEPEDNLAMREVARSRKHVDFKDR